MENAVNCPIEITNTNPKIIKVFIDFLRFDLKLANNKINGRIQIHEGDNKMEIEKYWSDISGIPISQFNKTIIRLKGKKIGKNRGTFTIRTYDKILNMKLQELLDIELKDLHLGE